MSAIPELGSYSATEPQSNPAFRLTTNQPNTQSESSENTSLDEQMIKSSTVQISKEALEKYQAYADSTNTGDTKNQHISIDDGTKIYDKNALSEEESKTLMAGLTGDTMASRQKALQEHIKALENANINVQSASVKIEQTYTSVLDTLTKDHPDLKGASFGFTVNNSGNIILTKVGNLNSEQSDRLVKFLNSSDELVKQANDLADAQIALFNTERFSLGINFSRENYAQTIDIGAELTAKISARNAPRDESSSHVYKTNFNNNWRQQLWANGSRENG